MPTYVDLYIAPLLAIAIGYFAGVFSFEASVILMLVVGLQDSAIVDR